MGDIFISYSSEDRDVVESLATALEAAGYRTVYFQRDCPPFCDHLTWTSDAIEGSAVVALVVSRNSIASHEVDSEVKWAHRIDRRLAPILVDLEWDELQRARPTWSRIIGTGVGATVQRSAVEAGIPRIISGLAVLGLAPAAASGTAPDPHPGLDGIVQAAVADAASRRTPVVDSVLLFVTMLRLGHVTSESFDRIGLPADLLGKVLSGLEDHLAQGRTPDARVSPELSPNARAVVGVARLLAQGAGEEPAGERHLLEAFVLHRESGIMEVLVQFQVEPELLAPGPWRDDGNLDTSRFSPAALETLREARRLAGPGLLGSPFLMAAMVSRHGELGGRREPPVVHRDEASTRVERILCLAELIARAEQSLVLPRHLAESIIRTQPRP